MKYIKILLLTAAGFNALPAFAHHSFAMFDRSKDMSLAGTVKEFQWTNPHAFLQLMVVDDTGQLREWSLEVGSPNALSHYGMKKNTFKAGDKVSVVIHPAKDSSPAGQLSKVTTSEGTTYDISGGGATSYTVTGGEAK